MYFSQDTDVKIKEFIESDDDTKKHAVFDSHIRPAFEKLIENLIFVYGFYTLDDVGTLKSECLSYLYETLPRFQYDRGTKGFSYFNVIARNWFIHKYREATKKNKVESELRYDLDHEIVRNDPSLILMSREDEVEQQEFWTSFQKEIENWRKIFTKGNETLVLEAVIYLLRNADAVSIYNRKAIFIYLKEMTGLNAKQISTNLRKMRELFVSWKQHYLETGENYPDGQRE